MVKRYETYVACNKRLKGKSTSPHIGPQRAAAQTSGYKPRFHKTTAFAISVEGSPDPALSEQGPSLPEDDNHLEGEPTQEEDEGLYIPSFLEEALGGDANLQIKMAHTIQAQERRDKKCFICQSGDHLMKDHYKVKNGAGPLQPKGPPQNKSAREMAKASPPSQATSQGAPSKVKGVPDLNPDPYCQFIGPKNWGKALIDDELMTCLLDNGSQLNFITPAYARKRGMDIMSLDNLAQEVGGKIPPILGIGGIIVDPEGFVMMNVKVPCVKGYNEDQIAIVMDDLGMKDCPVILGTPTIFRIMEVIKESEISKLAVPWASSRVSWLMRGVHARMSQLNVDDVANKSVAPLSVDEVVRVSLVLQGYRMNVMTHGMEKRSPLLLIGVDVQSAYAMLATGSNRVAVVLRNNTWDWLEIRKGTPVTRMVAANQVPRVIDTISTERPKEQPTLTEA